MTNGQNPARKLSFEEAHSGFLSTKISEETERLAENPFWCKKRSKKPEREEHERSRKCVHVQGVRKRPDRLHWPLTATKEWNFFENSRVVLHHTKFYLVCILVNKHRVVEARRQFSKGSDFLLFLLI